MIHGVLHLLDYDDATTESRRRMRVAEDGALMVLEGVDDGKNL
jgi:ssRNA-specific RNase YbeY (16S rRNA maturation enzyme)